MGERLSLPLDDQEAEYNIEHYELLEIVLDAVPSVVRFEAAYTLAAVDLDEHRGIHDLLAVAEDFKNVRASFRLRERDCVLLDIGRALCGPTVQKAATQRVSLFGKAKKGKGGKQANGGSTDGMRR
eukprot:jgi/Bigna1/130259/aug1.10_g4967